MNTPTAVRSPVQIGVLSFAHYHANFWSEALAARGALAGVWDSDVTRGREAAARFGTDFFDNIDALLARCTGVAICSETVMHPELVECAARRGLAILCEKPQGIDLPSCDRIAQAVRAAGVPFMQSFPKRLDPVTAYLRAIVQSGELGRITLVRIRHGHFYGLEPDFATRWYTDPARSGGGALLDEGVHGADMLAWFFGMPQSVSAMVSNATLGLDVEDLGIATFRYASGMLAELTEPRARCWCRALIWPRAISPQRPSFASSAVTRVNAAGRRFHWSRASSLADSINRMRWSLPIAWSVENFHRPASRMEGAPRP